MSFCAYSTRQRMNSPGPLSLIQLDDEGLPSIRGEWHGMVTESNSGQFAPDPGKLVSLPALVELMQDATGITWGLPNRNLLPHIILALPISSSSYAGWRPFAVYEPTGEATKWRLDSVSYYSGFCVWKQCWRMPSTDPVWPVLRDSFLFEGGTAMPQWASGTTAAERQSIIYSIFDTAGTAVSNASEDPTRISISFGPDRLVRGVGRLADVPGIFPWHTGEFLRDHATEFNEYLDGLTTYRRNRIVLAEQLAVMGYGFFGDPWWAQTVVKYDATGTIGDRPGISPRPYAVYLDGAGAGTRTVLSAFLLHPFVYTDATDDGTTTVPGVMRLVSRTPEDGTQEAPLFPNDCPIRLHRAEASTDMGPLLYYMPHEFYYGTPLWRMDVDKDKFLEVFGIDLSDRDVYITEGLSEENLVHADIGLDLSGFPRRATVTGGLLQLSVPAGTTVQDLDNWSNVPGGYLKTRAWDVFAPEGCKILESDRDQQGRVSVTGARLTIGDVSFESRGRLERGENMFFDEVVEEGGTPVAGFSIKLVWVANLAGQLTRFKGASVSEALDRVVVDRMAADVPSFQEPRYGATSATPPEAENQEGQNANT